MSVRMKQLSSVQPSMISARSPTRVIKRPNIEFSRSPSVDSPEPSRRNMPVDYSPLQPPTPKLKLNLGKLEKVENMSANSSINGGERSLSKQEEDEIRSQVTSRYLDEIQENFKLGRKAAEEDAQKREKLMNHAKNKTELENIILGRSNASAKSEPTSAVVLK